MRRGIRKWAAGSLSALGLVFVMAAHPVTDPAVADAAMRGDIDAVRTLVAEGADVNAAQGDGMTALHWAAERGDVALAELLVASGARATSVTRLGEYTPLHLASRRGSAAIATLVIQAGASIDARTVPGGATALHLAALSGDVASVDLLIQRGAEVDAREAEWGQTPLIFAASANRADAIRTLLAAGADPLLTTQMPDPTRNALDRAASQRRSAMLAEMTDSGRIEPTPTQIQAAIAAGREVYETGLPPEMVEEEEEPEEEEEEEGSRASSGPGGLTALHHAVRQGHMKSVVALLEGGADPNQPTGSDGSSPLLLAAINAQFDIAMLLLERGADPNAADALNGVSPLWATVNAQWQPRTRFPQPQEHVRQQTDYLELMEALLKAGADPNHRTTRHPFYMVFSGCGNGNCGLEDTKTATPFWRAAYATDVPAMKLLVAYGADPDMTTITPLDAPGGGGRGGRASRGGGAGGPGGPEAPREDPSGLPPVPPGGPVAYPIHAASGIGYGEGFAGNAHRHAPDGWLPAVRYLVEELGADVNARDSNGYNALHHAAARGDNELVLYLWERGADVTAISRRGQTVADMANGPVSRISPIPTTVALLEKLGSLNRHRCASC